MNKDAPAENRPKYRAGRKPTAVKVYTVNQESKYLVVENVPSIGVTKELLELCALYGTIEEYRYLDDYPCEEFTDVYWIKYRSLAEASSPLSVRYGPEYESIQETREKLQDRRTVVAIKTQSSSSSMASPSITGQRQQQLKRTNAQTPDNTINNYYVAANSSQPPLPPDPPPPPIFPQPDPNAYYHHNNYPQNYYPSSSQYFSYMSYQSNEPPIPGIGYTTTAPIPSHKDELSNEPISSTVLNIREKIQDASSVNLPPPRTNQTQSTENNIPTISPLSSSATTADTNTSPPVKK
ncbi:7194_t:CDS:2, partial [Ambispora leptoticha]